MSTPEEDLERTLHRQVEQVPGTFAPAPVTLASVQRRARRIRRRRTALTVVAAAAAVAVVLPVGLTLRDRRPPAPAAAPTTAPVVVPTFPVVADPPAEQTTGAELPIPYWYDGRVLAPDGTSLSVQSASDAPIDELVRVPGGGWSGIQSDDEGTLLRIGFDDSGSILEANLSLSYTVGVTPDGGQYAYLAREAPDGSDVGDWLVTRAGRDPMTWAVPGVTGDSGVAGLLSDGTVVITTAAGRVQLTRTIGSLSDLPGDYLKATSVSTATDRIAVQTSYRDDGTSCWAVVDVDGTRHARTCRWALDEFSPDGRYLLATDSASDGAGPRELVVLSAATLRPVARYPVADQGHFGPSVWAGSVVVTQAYLDGAWHLELLGLDGVRQVRGSAVPDVEGLEAPVRFAAGPLTADAP